MQQNDKLKNVCIYGIQEEMEEKLIDKILKLFNEKMKVGINAADILKCVRIGKNSTKGRPIIVKFDRQSVRNNVLRNCGKLQGTKIAIAEDFQKNLTILHEAQQRFDRKHVRTYDRNIYLIINRKHKGNTKSKILMI